MENIIKGKSHVLGPNIDTDQIYPGRYLELVDPDEIKTHCLEGVHKDFYKKINKGDIIIAGTNFGCGSSREHAAITLKEAGISMVIAESFARIFYRNAINLALPVIISENISKKVRNNDMLKVDLKDGLIVNETTGEEIKSEKMADFFLEIIQAGGVKNLNK